MPKNLDLCAGHGVLAPPPPPDRVEPIEKGALAMGGAAICELNLYTKWWSAAETVSWRVKNHLAPRNGPRIDIFRRPNVGK